MLRPEPPARPGQQPMPALPMLRGPLLLQLPTTARLGTSSPACCCPLPGCRSTSSRSSCPSQQNWEPAALTLQPECVLAWVQVGEFTWQLPTQPGDYWVTSQANSDCTNGVWAALGGGPCEDPGVWAAQVHPAAMLATCSCRSLGCTPEEAAPWRRCCWSTACVAPGPAHSLSTRRAWSWSACPRPNARHVTPRPPSLSAIPLPSLSAFGCRHEGADPGHTRRLHAKGVCYPWPPTSQRQQRPGRVVANTGAGGGTCAAGCGACWAVMPRLPAAQPGRLVCYWYALLHDLTDAIDA